jgi:hypothetical protein
MLMPKDCLTFSAKKGVPMTTSKADRPPGLAQKMVEAEGPGLTQAKAGKKGGEMAWAHKRTGPTPHLPGNLPARLICKGDYSYATLLNVSSTTENISLSS